MGTLYSYSSSIWGILYSYSSLIWGYSNHILLHYGDTPLIFFFNMGNTLLILFFNMGIFHSYSSSVWATLYSHSQQLRFPLLTNAGLCLHILARSHHPFSSPAPLSLPATCHPPSVSTPMNTWAAAATQEGAFRFERPGPPAGGGQARACQAVKRPRPRLLGGPLFI